MLCLACGASFEASGRRRYCSDSCRQAAWRHRRHTPQPPVGPITPNDTVYECPNCETRYLGEQRCADCNTFCRRLGPGGPCPHCDDPVTISDLIGTREPATPLT